MPHHDVPHHDVPHLDAPHLDAPDRDRPGQPRPAPAVPVAFDGLFGWYSPGLTRRGVVLCGTLGFEQLRAHRPWRALAEDLAGAGCATLRFDLPGEGDSADPEEVRLDALVGAVRRAIRFLRAAGAEEIVLVGLRFGATLAALAAWDEPVDRLALLAPFATGKAYLREMTLLGRAIDRLAGGAPIRHPSGAVAAGGFALEPALIADLAAVDLRGAPAAPEILVAGPDPAGLAARWAASGASVATAPFPYLTQLVSKPSSADLPPDAFAAITAFAADGARARPVPALDHRPDALPGTGSAITWVGSVPAPTCPIAGPGFAEEPILFGPSLFGILCRPETGAAAAGATLVFVNTGLDVRSGYGRRVTTLARELAARGVASLRMDVRGVGDSAPRADRTSPLYAPDAVDDVRVALDALEARGAGPVGIVGNCSGAYLAYRALGHDPRLAGAVMINLFTFAWNPKVDGEAALGPMGRSVSAYAGLLRRGHVWRRIARGDIPVAAVLATLARAGAARVARRLRGATRSLDGETPARQIAALRRRGARLVFVYGAGEPGLAHFQAKLGHGQHLVGLLGESPVIVPEVDHNLTTPGGHAAFRDLLLRFSAEIAPDAPRP